MLEEIKDWVVISQPVIYRADRPWKVYVERYQMLYKSGGGVINGLKQKYQDRNSSDHELLNFVHKAVASNQQREQSSARSEEKNNNASARQLQLQ